MSKTLTKQCDELFEKAGLKKVGKVGGTTILAPAERPDSGDLDSEPVLIDEPPIEEEDRILRTQEDKWRAHIGRRIAAEYLELEKLQGDLADKEAELNDVKSDVSDVKAEIAGVNAKLKSYAGQMRDIERGTFSPPLFDKHTGETLAPAKTSGVSLPDVGMICEIGRLMDYGLTGSMIAAISESQLAKTIPLTTIHDLEKAIAADEWWMKKIKGFGDTKVEKLIDALVMFRKENPIPSGEPDNRVKACSVPGCREEPSRGIYAANEEGTVCCPVCGSKDKWELIEEA